MKAHTNKQLYFYVWDDVLEDYQTGLIAVLAENIPHAWRLLKQEDRIAYNTMRDPSSHHYASNPRKVTKPEAFVRWGGS